MAGSEALLIDGKKRPETADGRVGVVMQVASGSGIDEQDNEFHFFDYRPGFFADIIQVRWDKGTMNAVLPASVADYLLRNNYARIMSSKEARSYNHALKQSADADQPKEKTT